ncbi:helix-turn-helix domain-containing protein [Rhabdobacter roseus]|uniref:AraC-like DNA-binding protein n=1 Tax=Rhabdobacter roseus TaxID=1655419 RepID=A0A840TZW2_9BACT|nr:helix-turn-helix domain-containing protein [Rhabdobacter roseus]MBB5287182.1 AraC-like DNA-binding protein [Rhabdobacter roseus]
MYYATQLPTPPLRDYVRFFWVLEGEVPPGQPYVHRSMADGCPELIFHYQGTFTDLQQAAPSFTAGMHGQAQRHSRFAIQESFGILGVYLYPFALPRLFGLPASALTNQQATLCELLGPAGQALEERVMLAPDNAQRIRLLSSFLEKQLAKNEEKTPRVLSAIQGMIQSQGTLRVQQLAEQSFLSTRQMERSFRYFTGFSPKLYGRILRFQAALSAYGNQSKSLTDIAYDCGYYDQSHFIHDFKAFSGHHPRAYFTGRAEGTEWKE